MKEVMEARSAIGTANTFIETQQPFPYVHLLSLITDVALVVNALSVGVHTGRQLGNDIGWVSMLLLVVIGLMRVAAFTLVYNGLLGIGISLDNPLGSDPADLPGLAYQACCVCACACVSACCVCVCTRARPLQMHMPTRSERALPMLARASRKLLVIAF